MKKISFLIGFIIIAIEVFAQSENIPQVIKHTKTEDTTILAKKAKEQTDYLIKKLSLNKVQSDKLFLLTLTNLKNRNALIKENITSTEILERKEKEITAQYEKGIKGILSLQQYEAFIKLQSAKIEEQSNLQPVEVKPVQATIPE